MNSFDYLFSRSKELSKDFVLGPKEHATFRDLYTNSLKLSEFLKTEIGENQNVLIISANSVFFITAYLAIIKSGNVCVPVPVSIEQKTLRYILSITQCNCVFSSDSISSTLEFSDVKKVGELDLAKILICYQPNESRFSHAFDKNRPAAIIFTSGSTGSPKGVVISHGNIISNTKGIIKGLQLTASDIMGVVLPFSYCYGLSLLHTHLRVGGSLVLINNFFFIGSVIKALKEYRCTGFAGVPSHFQILIRKSQDFLNTVFPDLKYVTQAGGKLHNIFIEEFTQAFPRVKFFVMYGQTEATARLSILPSRLLREKLGSVGKALTGVTLKLADENLKEVKVGEVGQVLAKGDNIMKGYYKDLDGTREAIKDGWLLTGDLARMDQDGFLYMVGRKKEIIKVGGRRVSPKEIESVILSIPQIVDCTIKGIDDDLLGEGIQANVVVKGFFDQFSMKQAILTVCNQNLALFKIPQVIHFEEQIKVNAAGKKVKEE
jgi:long-chain acyl-CoA synthetase